MTDPDHSAPEAIIRIAAKGDGIAAAGDRAAQIIHAGKTGNPVARHFALGLSALSAF